MDEKQDESNESDLRQLSMTIAAEIKYFITSDDSIIGQAAKFLKEFGLSILSPSMFLLAQDYYSNKSIYAPVRLGGSSYNICRLSGNNFNEAVELFHDNKYEKKKRFFNSLSKLLTDMENNEMLVVKDDMSLYSLISISRENKNTVSIPILRFLKKQITPELEDYIIGFLLNKAQLEHFKEVIISDSLLTIELCNKLEKYGFTNANRRWVKYLLPHILSFEDLKRLKGYSDNLDKHINKIESSFNKPNSYIEEKKIWPSKISDLNLLCYIIPIKPEWAMHLFDSSIANQNLFGSMPHLIFNLENIYYKSAYNNRLTAPSKNRLWYISGSRDIKGQTHSLKAASYCDQIYIDEPMKLYNKFKKYGVYERSDILNLAGGKSQILAFKFSMRTI